MWLFLSEFWEDHFKCRYPGAARTPYNAHYESMCSGREQLSADNIEFEAQLQFVTDAVLAFAVAIRCVRASTGSRRVLREHAWCDGVNLNYLSIWFLFGRQL